MCLISTNPKCVLLCSRGCWRCHHQPVPPCARVNKSSINMFQHGWCGGNSGSHNVYCSVSTALHLRCRWSDFLFQNRHVYGLSHEDLIHRRSRGCHIAQMNQYHPTCTQLPQKSALLLTPQPGDNVDMKAWMQIAWLFILHGFIHHHVMCKRSDIAVSHTVSCKSLEKNLCGLQNNDFCVYSWFHSIFFSNYWWILHFSHLIPFFHCLLAGFAN